MHIATVDEPNSFSVTDYFSDAEGAINNDMPSQKFTVEFREEDSKTRLVSRSKTSAVEQLEELLKMGMVEGFANQLNKLEVVVKSVSS